MNMLRCLSLTLILVSATALTFAQATKNQMPKQPTAQPNFVQIAPQGAQGWKPTKMTVTDLAKRVGFASANLKDTKANLFVMAQTPDGRGYYPALLLKVMDPKRYRVDYVVIQNIPFSATMVNDGKQRTVRLDTKIGKLPATAKLPAAMKIKGDNLVTLFETDFARLAYQGLTEGIDAWVPILTGMAKGAAGYKVSVEERRMTYQGQSFLSYRVLAKRPRTGVSGGSSTFELVFDGKRFLPVTIRNVRKDAKGKTWMVQWTANYFFNQKVALKDLKLGT